MEWVGPTECDSPEHPEKKKERSLGVRCDRIGSEQAGLGGRARGSWAGDTAECWKTPLGKRAQRGRGERDGEPHRSTRRCQPALLQCSELGLLFRSAAFGGSAG